jgi:hypothetical protein
MAKKTSIKNAAVRKTILKKEAAEYQKSAMRTHQVGLLLAKVFKARKRL